MCGSLSILWHCLSLGLEWKPTFSNPVATAEFSKFAGILSAAPSQHHLVVLPKVHLTLHSRMSDSKWVITPLWLSGLWRSFLYSSSVYSCHLFLISSASVRSIPFLFFIETIFAWNVSLVSLIFLKRSLVFPIVCFPLFLCTDHWERLSYLSLLFFRTLLSSGYILSFLLCFSPLVFSHYL